MSQDDSSPLTRDIAPFGVRMPPDLKERVSAAAKSNGRSMNAEIVSTLEREYPAPKPASFEAFIANASKETLAAFKKYYPDAPAPDENELLRSIIRTARELSKSPPPDAPAPDKD